MNIVMLTPGAGGMYCGGCLRDNALVAALRKLGHEVLMVPLYLPLNLDEPDQSAGTPIFFGGISVYLEQKFPLFRLTPGWFLGLLTAPRLLKWAGGKAAKTRAADLGDMMLSMLQGEAGNQARQLEQLIAWLKTQPRPDVICLSNALLIGMVRRLKSELDVPIACSLQGEDSFLDGLPESHRAACWRTLAQRAAEADLFISPSRYFADRMIERLGLRAERVKVVWNGINLEGYDIKSEGRNPKSEGNPKAEIRTPASSIPHPETHPTIGFFARMCPEKGLDTLVEAFIRLRKRGRVKAVRLRMGGSCGPADEAFVNSLRQRLHQAGLAGETEFYPNLDRVRKIEFLRSLTVFSVPALYGEAFGLYVIEALAAGVPVVLPNTAAFPELIAATGGGVVCAAGESQALADALEDLLLNPERARALGEAGRRVVFEKFSAEAMAGRMVRLFESSTPSGPASQILSGKWKNTNRRC
jgi:glycosyltransferase involved in cell wall biosynthesis